MEMLVGDSECQLSWPSKLHVFDFQMTRGPDHTNLDSGGVQAYNTPISKLTPFVPHPVSVIAAAQLEASLTHDSIFSRPGPSPKPCHDLRKGFPVLHRNGDPVSCTHAGCCSLATTATVESLAWENQLLPAEACRKTAGEVQGAWTTVWRWVPNGEEPRLLLRIIWGAGRAWQWATALVLSGRCRFTNRRCSANAVFAR